MCQPEGDINWEVVAMGDKKVVELIILTGDVVPVSVVSIMLEPRCGRCKVKGGKVGNSVLTPLI
eukprot:13914858-Ditylum_brightwellii.AAC.1